MFDERTIILKFLSNSTEIGNRNLQHVLQKCWKRVEWRCYAFYHPHIKPVLQQIRLLQVAWLLTYDWIKLRRSHTIYGSYVTLPIQDCFGPQNVDLLSSFCNNFSQPATTWFIARTLAWLVSKDYGFALWLLALEQRLILCDWKDQFGNESLSRTVSIWG